MADEEYNRKVESLQQYIPFLDNMIAQLKDPSKKNREQQLNKMQSLHTMITDKRKKLKLDTLIKCEDVISKLYEKVHNKPIGSKKGSDTISSTPASPSPTREIDLTRPLTIPTERLEESRIPKVDIYSSAAESLSRARTQPQVTARAKVPDMSKPPISLEDLKTLEEDVQEKINETSLSQASLYELNNLKEQLTEQIQMEEVLSRSPQKQKEELQTINTTVRNNLTLTKKLIQPPDKPKPKESPKPTTCSNKASDSTAGISSPKKELKHSTPIIKSPKILKEPPSIFGNILSHIDDQILGGNKKKEERRNSLTGKEEKRSDKDGKKKEGKHSTSKDDSNDEKNDSSKEAKKKERRSNSLEDKNKVKDEKQKKKERHHHQSSDKNKSKEVKKDADNKEEKKKEEKRKHSSGEKSKISSFSLTGKTSFETEEDQLKKNLVTKDTIIEAVVNKDIIEIVDSDDNKNNDEGKITVKKDLNLFKPGIVEKEESTQPTAFKRLADKYNPKPRKPTTELEVDKEVSDIIEENMKTSPPKTPVINQMPAPIPPPPSLLLCSEAEPEPAPKLPSVLQNILTPSTTQLINNVMNQLRQNNTEAQARITAQSSTPVADNFVSDYTREDNFVSDYTKEDFTQNDFAPNNLRISDFNNFSAPHARQDRLSFDPPPLLSNSFEPPSLLTTNFEPPPSLNNQFNQMNHQNQRFMSPNETFTPNRPFTPMPQGFPQQTFPSFQPNIQNTPADIQPLDYYPPNAPIPSNQFNSGPPLLSPEIPHFHNENKHSNMGMMSGYDSFGHNEDMRWRQEDNRFLWDRRDQDIRLNRDPRTYREYREMRDRDQRNRDPRDSRDPRAIRDPRVNRDLRENRDPRDRDPRDRDPRDRDPRDNRDSRDRDPRLNKDSRDFDRDPRFRDNRSQSRDPRPSRYDSKFDRMYTRTNRNRSRSRSRSMSYSNETFTSPLDSLYSGKEEHKTGKGYGVQNFRIPKIKKEEDDKEQSTKVSSTNEDGGDAVHPVDENSNDSANNEITGNDVETEDGQNEEVTKEDEANKIENEEEESKKVAEIETINQEPPNLDKETEEPKAVESPKPVPITQTAEQQDQAKPADQTILAQFFANLLGSQNKKEKKTALYSLISTFSDSFSEKELSKITKIIKADDEADSSEEEEVKKSEEKPEGGTSTEMEKEAGADVEETHLEDSTEKIIGPKSRRRIRRISSSHSLKDEKTKEEEVTKTSEPLPEAPNLENESVVVSVGERIKRRKRTSITPPKPKKKCKTELDMLHEDIQDMFIRDGVLTASGKRMCRILKSDPNALTTPQDTPSTEPQKGRKKPGPKPKQRSNSSEMKTMRNIRILIPKMPDSSIEKKEESPRRSLRSSTKAFYAESDGEDTSVPTEDDSVLGEGSVREDDSDAESTDTEKDRIAQPTDANNKTKIIKRRRGKGWASGNIPNSKKKKKKQLSVDELTDKPADDTPPAHQSFVEPDKNYYIDFVTNKSHECKLCDYQGRFITTHYKSVHPESEILTSRFSPAVAQEAIEDSIKNLGRYEKLLRIGGSGKYHFTCRFCAFNTNVPPTIFYDHITTHTGEYRHICPVCDFSASSGKTLKSHMSNVHNNADRRIARKSYSQTIVFGYMCGECHYVQMNQKQVEDHINIFHLQKPKVYKVNLSTTLDPETIKFAAEKKDPTGAVMEEESDTEKANKPEKVEKPMPPPEIRKRPRAGPKCMKERLKAKMALAEKDGSASDTSSVAESESSVGTDRSEKVNTPEPKTKPVASKKRMSREVSVSSEEELVIPGRSRRAAKDKATEKLKTLMELTENGSRKKSLSTAGDEGKNKKSNTENQKEQKGEENVPEELKPDEKTVPEAKQEPPKIKKEIELNVFTCKTDIQEENKKIQQERLQLMEELNKSVGSRTSLNFVDKLCDRLSNNDIMVKQEPTDDLTDSFFPPNNQAASSLVMPVLEKNLPDNVNESALAKAFIAPTPRSRKPVLQAEEIQVSKPNFDVTQKNDKLITDMIQKLKVKLANVPDDKSESSMVVEEMDYDSEGPPPLTHVNELPNVKPADGSIKSMLIGGMIKVMKYPNNLMFSCLVPPCVFSTENREAFQKHCSEAHKHQEKSSLCEMCGIEIVSTVENSLLENVFKHAIHNHSDTINDELKHEEKTDMIKPPSTILRIRKLSGDSLSSIKKDWEDEIDNAVKDKDTQDTQSTSTVSEITVNEAVPPEEPPPTMAELDVSDDNPFPFKIAGVMSLAEPLPPLAPIAKNAVQTPPATQLIVKEAKLSQAELSKPRKIPKAMAKFITSVSDLYKCPHYYCLFSTNFRDFLERHLKAHKMDRDVMVPCVYCDMKTPWEHVPMHIDIRHAHCRFACSYCLYRAVVKEYVFLHQDQAHPENDYSVIALPQPRHSKKWAIAEVKVEPQTLCEPYKCTTLCGLQFLFENEFRLHLQDVHKSNFIPCGYSNCTHRVQANKMPNHWALNHGVAVYQCAYCKVNSNEMKKVYHHFAMFHQGQQPNILIRILSQLKENHIMGYSAEAFANLRKVVNVPSNFTIDNKSDISAVAIPVILPTATYGAKPALQGNVTVPQPATKNILVPVTKPVINRTFTIVSTNSATSNAGNIVFLPSVTSSSALSGAVMSSSLSNTQITAVATSAETPIMVSSLPATIPATEDVTTEKISDEPVNDTNAEKDDENIAPLEHITLGEDSNQVIEETEPCEADPLSLEAENETSKSAVDSSGDESEEKSDGSKKNAKSGLLSYQLYRCAFCDISFSNSVDFKRHATYSVSCREDDHVPKPFICVHCGRKLKSPHVLVDHIQCHGVLRFTCSLCGSKFATIAQTRSHIKNRHNITHTSMTPLNPSKQNLDTDEYLVRPKLMLQMGTTKEAALNEPFASTSSGENIYTPETVDKIPMRHILSSTVKCGLCSYTTKVRTNMVRHLQFHSEEKAVSDTAPVNPVPCLEKNEKMFDKMINLASSSHASSRMGSTKGEVKETESESYPEFVPSHRRYVCCAHGCTYMCPEEGNLRHHLIALHDGDISFTCVHCKTNLTPTDADSLIKHFKFHALQLYKCQYCSFIHNLKHKVEKHVSDSHLDLPVKVITIRFMESEPKDITQEPSTSMVQSVAPPPASKLYKPWRCCMCKYKSGSQEGIQTHVLEKHEIDSQFKCALCNYKTNDKETFGDHFKAIHGNQTIDIIYAYRKLEEDKERETETFDTTPLWQRDRPRVRHIRGILFDESTPSVAKSPKKTKVAPMVSPAPGGGKTTAPSPGHSTSRNVTPSPVFTAGNFATPSPGPSGVKIITPSTGTNSNLDVSIESVVNGTADILKEQPPGISDDFFQAVNKLMKASNDEIAKAKENMVIVIEDEEEMKTPTAKNKDSISAPTAKNKGVKRKGVEVPGISKIPKISDEIIDLESSGSDTEQDEFSEKNLKFQFGGFGAPLWKQFKCPICNMFKSKRISDFIFHLFKEMKVFRFKCNVCTDESITYRYIYKHIKDQHPQEDSKDHVIPLAPNSKLLTWLQMVVRGQSLVIMENYPKTPEPSSSTSSNLVQCDFCDEKFGTEQEKNEHAVMHWMVMPYSCSSCKYEAYLEKDVEKHFRSSHAQEAWRIKENVMSITQGPTIEKLLKICDDQHKNETRAAETPKPQPEEPQVVEIPDPPKPQENKEDDATLSDNDLIIVTKTDSNVPKESDIFCCEYCAFMANSEVQVLSHITSVHEHMSINFKKLNRVTCEDPNEHVGCMLCLEVGSEVKIRQHHMEKHEGNLFGMYKFQCALCTMRKRFLKFSGLKVHFNRLHPGCQMKYTTLYNKNPGSEVNMKTYTCPICPYERNLKPTALNNMRQHLKQHFKAFMCRICLSTKYKTRADVVAHYAKDHPELQDHQVVQDMELFNKYTATMSSIIANAKEVESETVLKNVAKKSTATTRKVVDEYSYYGNQPEEVDLSKIMTSVEINGMHLNMSAEKLSTLFDLNVTVAIQDCNLAVNLSSVFDS